MKKDIGTLNILVPLLCADKLSGEGGLQKPENKRDQGKLVKTKKLKKKLI